MNMWKISTLVLGVALGASLTLNAVSADQPHMQKAKEHLEAAHTQLMEALHDKGGHRWKAAELCRQAKEEVEEGIKAGEKD
jgi:hypothetical protein